MAILEEKGYDVTGLDLNQEMLNIAQERCRGPLIRQDMRYIQVSTPFDALLCLGKAFSYMITDVDASRAINCFNRALRVGGILILDSFDANVSRRYQYGNWKEDLYEFESLKITRKTRSSGYTENDSSWFVEWEYMIENEQKKRVQDHARLRSYDTEKLEGMLVNYGFDKIGLIRERSGFTVVVKKVR